MKFSINKRRVLRTGLLVFVLVVSGALAYGYFQLKGLKDRATTTENRLNVAGFFTTNEEEIAQTDKGGEGLDIEVLSQGEATIKVFDGVDSDGGEKIAEKRVKTVKVKVTNPLDYPYDFGGSVSAQVDGDGKLHPAIEPYTTAVMNYGPATYFTVVPGGVAETTLYFDLMPEQKIIRLYDTNTQTAIDLN